MKVSLACLLVVSLALGCIADPTKLLSSPAASNTTRASGPAAAAPAPNAYLGCYNLSKIEGVTHKPTPQPATLSSCSWLCRFSNTSLTIYDGQRGCHCTGGVPSDAAKLPEERCAGAGDAGAAAVFYWHKTSSSSGCRVANVPMEPSSFDIAYNADKVSFSADGVMTIRMDGQDGSRMTTKDGMFMYGMYEVQGLIDGHPGVVSAFYVRSSDEYNLKNTGDFEEIDVEFINGNPTTPNTLWFNTFHRGASGGELAIPAATYAAKLGLANGTTNSNTWLRYTFDWQPDHVTWYVNGVPFERRYWGQLITWKDMKDHYSTRPYRPPTSPMHVVFSMWSDLNQKRAFGGVLDFTQSPFHSSFRELRRVLCDTKPGAAGPAWMYTPLPATSASTPAAAPVKAGVPVANGNLTTPIKLPLPIKPATPLVPAKPNVPATPLVPAAIHVPARPSVPVKPLVPAKPATPAGGAPSVPVAAPVVNTTTATPTAAAPSAAVNTTTPAASATNSSTGTMPASPATAAIVRTAAADTAATTTAGSAAPTAACTVHIAAYMQCGGKGGNCGTSVFGCVPTVWAGACCPSGMKCQASDAEGWYFGCQAS